MPKKKVPAAAKPKGAPRRRTKARQLVWVDQRPLRREAASECGRAMDRLEKARREWKRYEREDQPAYQRWMASTFGALMSRLRELEARVHEKENLVREVEREMHFGGSSSYRAAYSTVQRRRTHPEATPPPRREENAHFQEEEEELSEFEQELLFALRRVFQQIDQSGGLLRVQRLRRNTLGGAFGNMTAISFKHGENSSLVQNTRGRDRRIRAISVCALGCVQ